MTQEFRNPSTAAWAALDSANDAFHAALTRLEAVTPAFRGNPLDATAHGVYVSAESDLQIAIAAKIAAAHQSCNYRMFPCDAQLACSAERVADARAREVAAYRRLAKLDASRECTDLVFNVMMGSMVAICIVASLRALYVMW